MRQKKQFRSFLIYLILTVVVFVLGWQTAMFFNEETTTIPKITISTELQEAGKNIDELKEDTDLTHFWEVWALLKKDYVETDKLDNEEMLYGAIKGMVDALDDPFTVYMTPEETEQFYSSLEGKLEGIGAELTVKNKALVIVSPLRNSPAEEAGLLPKDVIYKIEGELANEMTLFEAVSAIRGEPGTPVTLTIVRDGEDKPFDVTIVRAKITVDSVTWEAKDDIAIVTINQFNDTTAVEFQKIITQILLDKMQGVIIDLRFNGGGYLDASVDLLEELIPDKTKVLSIERRNKENNQVMYVHGKGRLTDLPLVVLINQGSASASEIVAGAIQDLERGTLIGEQSFGKGTVQELSQLSDGSSIRLTVAKWFTANGRTINEEGITPDIVVELTEDDFNNDRDPQLDKAVEYLHDKIR